MKDRKIMKLMYGSRNFRALALFLAGMAFMTGAARAADNFLIPRVSVSSPAERKLEYHAQIQGQIQAEKETAVYGRENLRVAYVPVREGEQVQKGELLFAVDLDSLALRIQELEQEIRKMNLQIEDLQAAYQKQAEQQNRELQRAGQDYEETVSRAQSQVSQANLELQQAEETLRNHENQKPQEEMGRGKEEAAEPEEGTRNPEAIEPEGNERNPESAEAKSGMKNPDSTEPEEGTQNPGSTEPEGNTEEGETLAEWNQRQQELLQQYQEKQKAYEEILSASEEAVKTAARQLEDAQEETVQDHSGALLEIEKQKLEDSLKEYYKLDQAEGKIYAEVDGRVKTLNISAGSPVGSEPVMILEDFGQSFRFEGSMEEDENLRMEEGMEGVLEADGGNIRLEGVKISEAVLEEGIWQVSAAVDSAGACPAKDAVLSITKESSWYDAVISRSSLHYGEQENYIIRVREKETILGVETVAEYVPVTLLEKNADYAAVKGEISREDKIVTDTDKNIKEGERIRIMKE